jgi:UDP-3-O-[3-hydroxymyristoyl] glucosamine N-acyltransferase
MKFAQLVGNLGATRFAGDADLEIQAIAAVDKALPGQLSYIDSAKFAAQVATTQASVLIVPKNQALQQQATQRGIAWLESSYPRLTFAQAIDLFYQPYKPAVQIHPTAVIDPTATIGQNVAIGAHVVIEADVVIGDAVCIHPNVVIYPGCQIGDRTILHANCTIQERSQIGADCIVNSGSVIGGDGFGHVPTPQGWYKMQQSGYVVLEDKVEIGCNCTVDRPAVGETRIGRDTKFDNMIHIGHGVTVGQNCAMAAQVGIAGGATIGNRVIIAGQCGVANNVHIGDGVTASSRTGIHHDIEPGKVVSGYPAVDHPVFLRSSILFSRLPEMYQTLKKIKKQLGIED